MLLSEPLGSFAVQVVGRKCRRLDLMAQEASSSPVSQVHFPCWKGLPPGSGLKGLWTHSFFLAMVFR